VNLIISWLTLALGFWLAGKLIDGFDVRDFKQAIYVAAGFAVVHFFIGWLFFGALTLGTLGLPYLLGLGFLVRWAVSTIILKITDAFMDSLTIRGWAPAFWGAGLLSVLSAIKDAVVH
jgi:uncharacterized membrane protein YvlD (DUF360 family)